VLDLQFKVRAISITNQAVTHHMLTNQVPKANITGMAIGRDSAPEQYIVICWIIDELLGRCSLGRLRVLHRFVFLSKF
jgi:hypothetical protein